jgi:predicted nuclease with TOPRIM domain
METVETQVVETPETKNTVETKVETPTTQTQVETKNEPAKTEPFKVFASKEEFDRHSAGILNSAKNKAEKELLALLGLKPDEKDKLAKFKEAYDNTLSESEKQAKNLENLNNEVNSLKNEIAEKDAIISALSQMTGKTSADVIKYIKMAKGLVDENTTIEQALSQVFTYTKAEKKTVPTSKPLNEPSVAKTETNPFKTDNLTEQGKLIKSDREKAREMYFAVYGKAPSW